LLVWRRGQRLIGLLAGILSFCSLRLAGGPPVDRAILFENAMVEAKAKAMARKLLPKVNPVRTFAMSENAGADL
jgi:hypothetical protein